jgi:hypothetical protein
MPDEVILLSVHAYELKRVSVHQGHTYNLAEVLEERNTTVERTIR